MSTSSLAAESVVAKHVRVTGDTLVVELVDGRSVSVPLKWYPRLAEGRPSERRNWELIGPGIGIHWPQLDEDISIEGLLLGQRSSEGAASSQRWRASRRSLTTIRPPRVKSADLLRPVVLRNPNVGSPSATAESKRGRVLLQCRLRFQRWSSLVVDAAPNNY